LALSSAAVGGGTSSGSQTPAPSPRTAGGPQQSSPFKVSVDVKSQSATSMTLSVSGVSSHTRPFALVLGQSISNGWQATIGNQNLGAPVLIDGFANGWRVDPATLSDSSHGGSMSVSLRWAPQRRVNLALILSALSILGCIVLVLATTRRRWAGRADDPNDAMAVSLAEPELAIPVETDRGRVASEAALGIAFAMGVIAGLIATPLVGLVVFAASGVVLRFPKTRLLLGLAAAGCLFGLGVYVTVRQSVFHFQANGGWPARFDNTAGLAWAAVLFLVADAAIELIMRRVNQQNADGGITEDSPEEA
jgi:arabinofuranan 3-O-arabinosyltransferase